MQYFILVILLVNLIATVKIGRLVVAILDILNKADIVKEDKNLDEN